MNSKFKSMYERFVNMEQPKMIDWLLVLGLVFFCYISYNHGDILCTSTHGKDLVECILNGTFFDFYDYTQSTAVYSITVYIVFAIWSIPVFLIYGMLGIPMWGVLDYYKIPFPVLMWYKLLPTLFYIGIAFVLYKIVLEIKKNRNLAKWAAFLFFSSPIAMFSQFIFGQYDSIGLFFTVLALYLFIKKRYYCFSLVVSLAITYKIFAIFFFIPLILLVEKRLWHLIKYGLIAMSGYIITTLMFSGSVGYTDAMAFSGGIAPRLFSSGINTTMGTISLFTVAMMTICVVAFNKKIKNDDEYYSYSLYIPFFVYATMFMFVLWHPQWVIFLVPFLTLVFFLNSKTNSVLILHSAMAVGYVAITVLCFVNNVDTNLLSLGIFPKFVENAQYDTVSWIFALNGILGNNFFYSLFAGALLILIVMYLPTKERITQLEISTSKDFDVGNRGYMLLRIFTLLLFIVPTIWTFVR